MQDVYRGPAMAAPPFDALYGLEIEAATAEEARGAVPVSDGVRQPAGLVHGGVYASMAESLAVAATEAATGRIAVGHSSQTSFLRPITAGTVHATGRPRHTGRSTWVWEFDVTDDDGRLCALVRMTVALR
jgi:1,4-dihydroxy-2-naphthoyl-CoA hydrolase